MSTMLPKKLIATGGEYVIKPPGHDHYADKPERWLPVVVLGEARIPHTSTMGWAVAMANTPFHKRFKKGVQGMYKNSWVVRPLGEVEWTYRVVSHRLFRQLFKDWQDDVLPVIKQRRDEIAEQRKQAREAEKERKKRDAEYAKQQKALQEQQKEQQATEVKLRTVLNNFGINDSDGWRGINSKQRFSQEKNEYVLETYVRHLTLDDVLRLTGGLEEPKAATTAKKASRKGGHPSGTKPASQLKKPPKGKGAGSK